MKKVCPKCHSQIEKFDMAEYRPNGQPTNYISTGNPKRYRCIECDWTGEIKK